MTAAWRWAPLTLLTLGAALTIGIDAQRRMPLRQPLAAAIPTEIAGYQGRDLVISEEVARVAAATESLMRVYESADSAGPWLYVYVGYYESQAQGKTIHSPKNCLPGTGWEALNARHVDLVLPDGSDATVNRYVLQRNNERVLVLYWYQGRGRIEANEYRVKWNLLRDSALKGRSDEALIRIVVPIIEGEAASETRGLEAAGALVPALAGALPV